MLDRIIYLHTDESLRRERLPLSDVTNAVSLKRRVRDDDKLLEFLSCEEDIFAHLGLQYEPPEARNAQVVPL